MRAQQEKQRQQAEASRRAAEEARRRAELARQAALAAQELANKNGEKADQREAARQSKNFEQQDLVARRAEAKADLDESVHKQQMSQADDAAEGRGADRPSAATLDARDDVKRKRSAANLLEPPAAGKPSPLDEAGHHTDALLKDVADAAKPVFDAQARNKEPSKKQTGELDQSVKAWQDAAENEVRLAGVQAQARGEDPVAAMKKQAQQIAGRLPKTGPLGSKGVHKCFDDLLGESVHQVKTESPGQRQILAESYDTQIKDNQHYKGAARDAAQADKTADKAQAYADGFGTQDDPQAVAARESAKNLRQIANDAQQHAEHLKPDSEQRQIDRLDLRIKLKQQEVDDRQADHTLAVQSGDPKRIEATGALLGKTRDDLRVLKSVREEGASTLDLGQAKDADADAVSDWERQRAGQPELIVVTRSVGGGKGGGHTQTSTIEPPGYDRSFWAVPRSPDAERVHKADDGRYYLHTGKDDKVLLNPAAARRWETHDALQAANARAAAATEAVNKDIADFGTQGSDSPPGRLDFSQWEGRAQEIGDNVQMADKAVADARVSIQAAVDHGASKADLDAMTTDLGCKLEVQKYAHAEADALKDVRAWRGAELGQGSGSTPAQPEVDKMRDDLRKKIGALDNMPHVSSDDLKNLHDLRAQDDKLMADIDQTIATEGKKSTGSKAYHDALYKKESIGLTMRGHELQIQDLDLQFRSVADEELFGRVDTQGPKQDGYGPGGVFLDSDSKDHVVNGGDANYLIAPPKDAAAEVKDLKPGDDGSWTLKDGTRLSPDKKTWTFTDGKQITERDGKYFVSFEERHGMVGEDTTSTSRSEEHELDPLAQRMWRTTGRQLQLNVDRQDLQQDQDRYQAKFPTEPPKGTPPQLCADGQPVPALNFGDDLVKRRTEVTTRIDDLTSQLAALPPPGAVVALEPQRASLQARLDVAHAELVAVDAMAAWKADDFSNKDDLGRAQTRRTGEAEPRPGLDVLDERQAAAQKACSAWLALRDRQVVVAKQQKVDELTPVHATWKAQHPGATKAQEENSDTWKALQTAKADHKQAQDRQTRGSTRAANTNDERAWITSHLRPDQYSDNRELYKLFEANPQVMAQGIINEHYLQYGDQPIMMRGRTHMGEEVRRGLNLPNEGLTPQQREMEGAVVDQMVKVGGDHAKVTVLPVVYALDGRGGGVVKTALFKVEGRDGVTQYVDEEGKRYKDIRDYRANNSLPADGVHLVIPKDGKFEVDPDGNVKVSVLDARTETGWETVRRRGHLDPIIGGVAGVAGIVLTVGSGGTLIAAGAALVVAGATLYGAATSAQSLHNQAAHGLSLGWSNRQARMDWLNLAGAALAVPTMGVANRASALLKEVNSVAGAGKTVLTGAARNWKTANQVMGGVSGVVGGVAFEEGGRSMLDSWGQMSDAEKSEQIGMTLLNVVEMAAGGLKPRLRRQPGLASPTVQPLSVGMKQKGGWPVTDAQGKHVATIKVGQEGFEFVDGNGTPLPAHRVQELQQAGPLIPPGQPAGRPTKQPTKTVPLNEDGSVYAEVSAGGIVFQRRTDEGASPLTPDEIADWMEGDSIYARQTQGHHTVLQMLEGGMGVGKSKTKGIAVLDLPEQARNLLANAIPSGEQAAGSPPVAVAIASGDSLRQGFIPVNPLNAQATGKPTPMGSYIPRRAATPSQPDKGFPRSFDAEKVFFEAAGRALRQHARQQGIAPARIQGNIRVYVDRDVCDSCLSVSAQFQREFPGVRVRVKSTDHDPMALPAALVARDSYNKSPLNPQGSGGLVQWTRASDAEVQALTGQDPAALEAVGLSVRVYKPDPDLAAKGYKPMVVFRGSEVGSAALPNWRDNVLHGLGRQTRYDRIAADIGTRLQGQDVILVGHSLGGRLAAEASRTSGLDAITFNPAGLNRKARESLPETGGRVTAYQLRGDPLTWLQNHTPLPSAVGQVRTLPGPRRGAMTLNHLMGPVVDSIRRSTPSGRQIDADLLHQTRLAPNDPRMRRLLRGLDRAGTPQARAAADLIRSGELRVNYFKRDPLGVKRDGFYVERADYIGITVPRGWLGRSQRVAGIATHEAVHYMNRDAADPHAVDIELQAARAQGAVDPRHWSNRVPDDADLRVRLTQAEHRAPGGDSMSTTPAAAPASLSRPRIISALTAGVVVTGGAALGVAAILPDSPPTSVTLSAVAVGSMIRAGVKIMRFGQAERWRNKQDKMKDLLTPKGVFERSRNALVGQVSTTPGSGRSLPTQYQVDKFNEAVTALSDMKPLPGEGRRAYQHRIHYGIDRLVSTAGPLNKIKTTSKPIDELAASMKALVRQKARFDIHLRQHDRFTKRLGGFVNGVPADKEKEITDGLKNVTDAEALLRDRDPANDEGALKDLKKALKGLDEIAEKLRPSSSPFRIAVDAVSVLTYSIGFGALVETIANHSLPAGAWAVGVTGVLAGSSAFDSLRIGAVRFDDLVRYVGIKRSSLQKDSPAAADAFVFKKLLTGLDEGFSFAGGAGLAYLAIKNGLPDAHFQDWMRMGGSVTYTATSLAQFAEGLGWRRGYKDPTSEQRPLYLKVKIAAGAGSLALVVTSLIAGGAIKKPADPVKPPPVPSTYSPDEPMRGHGPLPPRLPIERVVVADGSEPETAGSFWTIARSNQDWIVTPQEQASLGSEVSVERVATQRLSQFNGFNPRLMDGHLTKKPGDPDLLPEGWKVNVNVLGLIDPPSS